MRGVRKQRMDDEMRFGANAFDRPSIFVGQTKSEINEAIEADVQRLFTLNAEAERKRALAKSVKETGSANADKLDAEAADAEAECDLWLEQHAALLDQTPTAWPSPGRPQYITREEHRAFCQKLLDDWKSRDPENAPATVEEFMIDCYGNWPD